MNQTGPTSTAMSAIRVYLVDDQTMIRSALKNLLNNSQGIEVVGDQGDARQAVEEIPQIRPDVVLLDITMPGLSGLDAIRLIRKASPKTKVVMLTHHEGHSFVEQALQSGAEGYLSKSSNEAELTIAIEAVHRGDPYVSPKVSGGLVSQVRGSRPGDPAPASRLGSLTPREREVFQLLALGRCNKEVARELDVSLGTAKKHRENLQRKLNCHSAPRATQVESRPST